MGGLRINIYVSKLQSRVSWLWKIHGEYAVLGCLSFHVGRENNENGALDFVDDHILLLFLFSFCLFFVCTETFESNYSKWNNKEKNGLLCANPPTTKTKIYGHVKPQSHPRGVRKKKGKKWINGHRKIWTGLLINSPSGSCWFCWCCWSWLHWRCC